MFDDTVAANIRMGHAPATDEMVRKAARVAGAQAFVDEMPEGFATRVGRSGNTLSVGQKQRLAIARGVVSPAPVLVLDEPTAALDPTTEAALMNALQAERERRLLIVIAHRLSTIRAADKIVFIEAGRVVEVGRHDELMGKAGGAYRRYVELQSSEDAVA